VSKHLPAPWTPPLREPPPARQVDSDPRHENREIGWLTQLKLSDHETQKKKAEKEHDDKIPSRHVATP